MLEPIVALATPPLKSALAVIRISGDGCFDIVSKMFSRKIDLEGKNKIFVGDILDNDELVDEVVLLAYKGPYSFTGEDSIEIICHGSMIIANQIVSLCIKNGCRYALNGEYTNRAFLNKKLDLIEAEAVNDVINATSIEAKKLSLMSLKGQTSNLVEPIRTKIADILSLIEVNIDYPEYEDVEVVTKEKILTELSKISTELKDLIKNGYKGNIIKDGVKIAIVGKPNAGKSSLLNALLNEDKAIVTAIPGTTRDIVEGTILINGVTLYFKDTAGIRESDDIIENQGILKSKKAILEADLVLYIVDSTDENEDESILESIKNKEVVKVYNKNDLSSVIKADGISISALNKDIQVLKNEIYTRLNLTNDNYVNPSINNMRDLGLLEKIEKELSSAVNLTKNDCALDLISINLTNAYALVLELLGLSNDCDISQEIFSRFCVGK
jgi:tRNA modification GTPase